MLRSAFSRKKVLKKEETLKIKKKMPYPSAANLGSACKNIGPLVWPEKESAPKIVK
jgi:hypothetical protein